MPVTEPTHLLNQIQQTADCLAQPSPVFAALQGSSDLLQMVFFTSEPLAARKYPSDPPKGKGGRISESSGGWRRWA